MKHTLAMTIAALALAAPVAGQGVMVAQPSQAQGGLEKQALERVAVESRVTPGAPYAADSVTESVQLLSDGNRIARKTATRIYRDSEGRTRREQLSSTGEVQSVSISDPVAGSMYVLNPAAKIAHRNGVIMTSPTGFATASVAPGSSGTVTAVRTPEGGTRVVASDASGETARRREVETQAVAVAAAGGGGRGGGPGSGEPTQVRWYTRPRPSRSLAPRHRVATSAGPSTRKISARRQSRAWSPPGNEPRRPSPLEPSATSSRS